MNPFLKAMRPKKKRPVDPNAPPRPNLMSHDKVIRDQKAMLEELGQEIARLRYRIDELEQKSRYQTQYLSTLHQSLRHK